MSAGLPAGIRSNLLLGIDLVITQVIMVMDLPLIMLKSMLLMGQPTLLRQQMKKA